MKKSLLLLLAIFSFASCEEMQPEEVCKTCTIKVDDNGASIDNNTEEEFIQSSGSTAEFCDEEITSLLALHGEREILTNAGNIATRRTMVSCE